MGWAKIIPTQGKKKTFFIRFVIPQKREEKYKSMRTKNKRVAKKRRKKRKMYSDDKKKACQRKGENEKNAFIMPKLERVSRAGCWFCFVPRYSPTWHFLPFVSPRRLSVPTMYCLHSLLGSVASPLFDALA